MPYKSKTLTAPDRKADLAAEIRLLRKEVAALAAMISEMVLPSETLAIAEKTRIIREAHASGDRAKIRLANKRINTG